MITIKASGMVLEEPRFKFIRFAGGEVNPRILAEMPFSSIWTIHAHIERSEDIMTLLMVTDALRRRNGSSIRIDLDMPYVPYARQDRVCAPGEALGAKVFCDLINAQNYNTVTIWDAHSDVVPALLDRCINIHCADFVTQFAHKEWILVAPDGNAAKQKVPECARRTGCMMIEALKHRDVYTGKITGTVVLPSREWSIAHSWDSPTFLIVDDICDGGRTFTELASYIRGSVRNKPSIKLYTTHGIYAQGFGVFDGLIDEVITPNPWGPWRTYGNEATTVKFTYLKKGV